MLNVLEKMNLAEDRPQGDAPVNAVVILFCFQTLRRLTLLPSQLSFSQGGERGRLV